MKKVDARNDMLSAIRAGSKLRHATVNDPKEKPGMLGVVGKTLADHIFTKPKIPFLQQIWA